MTTRTINVLGFALALQVALVGIAAYLGSAAPGQEQAREALVPLQAEMLTRLTIEDGDGNHVTLARVDGGWRLPDYFDMPVDEHKRADVIGRLMKAAVGWPVATSAATAKRFRVAEDAFERHVTFEAADADAVELYLGTSPGFRRVHARLAGNNDIYAIEFSNYELPAKAADWMDKALLAPKGTITRIESNGWTLSRAENPQPPAAGDEESAAAAASGTAQWTLEGAADDETLDGDAIQELVDAIANLQVESVVSDDEAAKLEGAKPAFSLRVTTDGGERYAYSFFTVDGGYALRSDRRERAFKVAKYIGDRLNVPRDKLLEHADEPVPEGDADPA